MRQQRTVTIWDKCECGKTLMSLAEAERGSCSSCWFAKLRPDTKAAMNRMISAAFRPQNETTESEKGDLIDDAFGKLNRDMKAVAK